MSGRAGSRNVASEAWVDEADAGKPRWPSDRRKWYLRVRGLPGGLARLRRGAERDHGHHE